MLSYRFLLRSVRRRWLLTGAIVLTLGLAIAVNTALFSVFDGLVFKPLPFVDADRVVHLSAPSSHFLRVPGAQVLALEEKLLFSPLLTNRVRVRSGELLQDAFDESNGEFIQWHLIPAYVSPGFFPTLGLTPLVGRVFNEDDALNTPRPAVIGYDLWRTRFGGESNVIGRVVEIPGTVNRVPWLIVGVMPQDTNFPKGANFWIPIRPSFVGYPRTPTFAKLAPGISITDIRRELPGVIVTPLREYVRPKGAFGIGMLVGAAAILLAVAWVHAAGLVFSGLTGRASEIGVRLALGAGSHQIVWLFACEAVILCVSALTLAGLLAPVLTTGVLHVLPEYMTVGQQLRPGIRAFAFAGALSCAALASMLLLPVTFLRYARPVELLRSGLAQSAPLLTSRLRGAFLVVQVVLVTILVYASGVAVHSYVRLGAADLGFQPGGLLAIRIPPITTAGTTIEPTKGSALSRHRNAVRSAVELLGTIPGVRRISGADAWPLQPLQSGPLTAESDPAKNAVDGQVTFITLGYPSVVGARVVEGAEPVTAAPTPSRSATGFALVNESLARQLAAFGPVVGQTIGMTPILRYRIVGILNDIKSVPIDLPAPPTLFAYLPAESVGSVLLLRVDTASASLASSIRSVLQTALADHSEREIVYLTTVAAKATSEHRARAILLVIVSVQALMLTIIGFAGAIGYDSQQRAKQIAIELALGAEPARIRWKLIRRLVTTTALALIVGLVAAVFLVRIVSSFLYGVAFVDTPTVIAVTVLLATTVVFAAWLPARRATAVDVMTTLRNS